MRGQQWGRVSFPEAPLVSLDDKEKDVLCPLTQLGSSRGARLALPVGYRLPAES